MRPENTSHRIASPGSYEGRATCASLAPLFIVRGSWRRGGHRIVQSVPGPLPNPLLWDYGLHWMATRRSIKYSLARVKIRLFEDDGGHERAQRTIKSACSLCIWYECSTKYVAINLRPQYTRQPSNLIQTGVNCKASTGLAFGNRFITMTDWMQHCPSFLPMYRNSSVVGCLCPPAAVVQLSVILRIQSTDNVTSLCI